MLEKHFQSCEQEREASSGINRLSHHFIGASVETPVLDYNERRVIALILECTLHRARIFRSVPFDENSLIQFDRLHVNLSVMTIHLPIPPDPLSGLKPATTF